MQQGKLSQGNRMLERFKQRFSRKVESAQYQAIQLVSEEFNISIPEYCVTGEPLDSFFAHKWYIACDQNIDEQLLASKIDEKLIALNDDYAVERKSALKAVSVSILKESVFLSFLQSKGKIGGQHKFPRVLKGDILKDWKDFISKN